MPTEFIGVRCSSDACMVFQCIQSPKSKKFQCRVCGTKQSIRKIYAQSYRAKDIRTLIQQYNFQEGPKADQRRQTATPSGSGAGSWSLDCGEDEASRFFDPDADGDFSDERDSKQRRSSSSSFASQGDDNVWQEFLPSERPSREVLKHEEEEDSLFRPVDPTPKRGGRGGATRGATRRGQTQKRNASDADQSFESHTPSSKYQPRGKRNRFQKEEETDEQEVFDHRASRFSQSSSSSSSYPPQKRHRSSGTTQDAQGEDGEGFSLFDRPSEFSLFDRPSTTSNITSNTRISRTPQPPNYGHKQQHQEDDHYDQDEDDLPTFNLSSSIQKPKPTYSSIPPPAARAPVRAPPAAPPAKAVDFFSNPSFELFADPDPDSQAKEMRPVPKPQAFISKDNIWGEFL